MRRSLAERDRETEKDRERQRETEKDRERERQRETERETALCFIDSFIYFQHTFLCSFHSIPNLNGLEVKIREGKGKRFLYQNAVVFLVMNFCQRCLAHTFYFHTDAPREGQPSKKLVMMTMSGKSSSRKIIFIYPRLDNLFLYLGSPMLRFSMTSLDTVVETTEVNI